MSPHPYSIWTRQNWTLMQQTLQETKNKNKQKTERVRSVIRWNSRVVVYIQKHSNGRRGHREKERECMCTLTAFHTSHRPCIPFGHVLIEHRCGMKHCNERWKEMRIQQTKKAKTHHKTTTKSTVRKTNNYRERVRIVWSDEKLELSRLKNTTAEGMTAWPQRVRERKGERVHEYVYTYCHAYLSPHSYSIWTSPR